MQRITATLLMALALAAWCGGGFAGTIYDNGDPDQAYVYFSDSDYPFQVADDFVLSAGASSISDIHWWGAYAWDDGPVDEDDFTVAIYSDSSGVPGAAIFSQNVGSANRQLTSMVGLDGFRIFSYSVCVSPIQLAPSTTYWLSVVNDTTGHDSIWGWSTSSNLVGAHAYVYNGGQWQTAEAELAFSLTDDCVPPVPEPSSMALLGFGALGFVARRRLLTRR